MKKVDFEIRMMDPKKLKNAKKNPNLHSERAKEELRRSINELGFRVPILARPDKTILDGHARREVAVSMGLKQVPVVFTDLPEEKVGVLMAAIKRISDLSGFDDEVLLEILEQADNQVPGFNEEEIQQLLDRKEKEASAGGEENDAPAAPGHVRHLYQCPKCGYKFTSRDAKKVKKLVKVRKGKRG